MKYLLRALGTFRKYAGFARKGKRGGGSLAFTFLLAECHQWVVRNPSGSGACKPEEPAHGHQKEEKERREKGEKETAKRHYFFSKLSKFGREEKETGEGGKRESHSRRNPADSSESKTS